MTYLIGEPCVDVLDRACVEECPVDCTAARKVPEEVVMNVIVYLFRAIWVQGLHLSSAHGVRRLVTDVMWPQEAITDRLASPDIPSLLLGDPDLARIVRRLGGTITPDGGSLTATGWRRIRQWRREWLALPSQVVPGVIGPDQIARPGIDGLRYLAALTSTAGPQPRLLRHAGTGPHGDARPAANAAHLISTKITDIK